MNARGSSRWPVVVILGLVAVGIGLLVIERVRPTINIPGVSLWPYLGPAVVLLFAIALAYGLYRAPRRLALAGLVGGVVVLTVWVGLITIFPRAGVHPILPQTRDPVGDVELPRPGTEVDGVRLGARLDCAGGRCDDFVDTALRVAPLPDGLAISDIGVYREAERVTRSGTLHIVVFAFGDGTHQAIQVHCGVGCRVVTPE